MTKEKIKEFLEGAKQHIEMFKKFGINTCPVCGMKAESFEKLVEEVKSNQKKK